MSKFENFRRWVRTHHAGGDCKYCDYHHGGEDDYYDHLRDAHPQEFRKFIDYVGLKGVFE